MLPMTTISGWGPLPDLVREMAGEHAFQCILTRHGLPISMLDMSQRRVPLTKMVRVFEASAKLLGDEEFGALVGENTTPEHYGHWAAYAYSAATLGEGLTRVCRTIWAHETGSEMLLSERQRHVVWSYATGLAKKQTVRQFSDRLINPMVEFIRSFLGPDWAPDWIEFDYPQPDQSRRLAGYLDVQKIYDQPFVSIAIRKLDLSACHIPGTALPRPITLVDLLRYRNLRIRNPAEQVLEAIDLCLADGKTDIDSTARFLDQGPRALQRRLKQHGMNFRELLQIARRRRAVTLLVETDLSIKAIAADLGYRSPENFTRAFRDWYEINPSEFRNAGR